MTPIVTNEAALAIMAARRTALALSVIHLVQDSIGTMDANTTQTQLAANEATFTGYSSQVITAFLAPYLDPAGGVSMQAPTEQFDSSGSAIQNMIRGWWLEDAGGDVQVIARFDNDIPMADIGNSIPLDVKFNQPN